MFYLLDAYLNLNNIDIFKINYLACQVIILIYMTHLSIVTYLKFDAVGKLEVDVKHKELRKSLVLFIFQKYVQIQF